MYKKFKGFGRENVMPLSALVISIISMFVSSYLIFQQNQLQKQVFEYQVSKDSPDLKIDIYDVEQELSIHKDKAGYYLNKEVEVYFTNNGSNVEILREVNFQEELLDVTDDGVYVFRYSCINSCNEVILDKNDNVENLPLFIEPNKPRFISVRFKVYVNDDVEKFENDIVLGSAYVLPTPSDEQDKVSKGAFIVFDIVDKTFKNRNFLLDFHMMEPRSTYRVEFGRFGRRVIRSDKIKTVLRQGEVYDQSPQIVTLDDKVKSLNSPQDDDLVFTVE